MTTNRNLYLKAQKKQITCLTAADKNYINILVEYTQFQKGSTACGLYSNAFATEICFRYNPASYRFVSGLNYSNIGQ